MRHKNWAYDCLPSQTTVSIIQYDTGTKLHQILLALLPYPNCFTVGCAEDANKLSMIFNFRHCNRLSHTTQVSFDQFSRLTVTVTLVKQCSIREDIDTLAECKPSDWKYMTHQLWFNVILLQKHGSEPSRTSIFSFSCKIDLWIRNQRMPPTISCCSSFGWRIVASRKMVHVSADAGWSKNDEKKQKLLLYNELTLLRSVQLLKRFGFLFNLFNIQRLHEETRNQLC